MRILILREISQNSIDDIYSVTDYSRYEYTGAANVGNKLWFSGLVSTVSTDDNQITFLTSDMSSDYINENFDLCIKPEANIFSPHFIRYMDWHVERFKGVRIPIYVIACGAQAESYDKLDELVNSIREPATKFIKSVYATGGEFALRGWFTYELFSKLGFPNAVVTGCPSLYQVESTLRVEKSHLTRFELKPALNGEIPLCKKALADYKDSEFFDQGIYYGALFEPNWKSGGVLKYIKKYGAESLNLIKTGRMNLFIDMPDWIDYLKLGGFNFSCGSRIHGNIISILAGVPAAVCALDSRTREMAEFFDIPIIKKTDMCNKDLFKIYEEISYEKFNETFSDKYEVYRQFLISHGIVKDINPNGVLLESRVKNDTSRQAVIEQQKKDSFDLWALNYLAECPSVCTLIDGSRRSLIKLRTMLRN